MKDSPLFYCLSYTKIFCTIHRNGSFLREQWRKGWLSIKHSLICTLMWCFWSLEQWTQSSKTIANASKYGCQQKGTKNLETSTCNMGFSSVCEQNLPLPKMMDLNTSTTKLEWEREKHHFSHKLSLSVLLNICRILLPHRHPHRGFGCWPYI